MKTLYDQLPLGTESVLRSKVNQYMNTKKFTGSELREFHYIYHERHSLLARTSYPFVDFLWDEGVKKIRREPNIYDNR